VEKEVVGRFETPTPLPFSIYWQGTVQPAEVRRYRERIIRRLAKTQYNLLSDLFLEH